MINLHYNHLLLLSMKCAIIMFHFGLLALGYYLGVYRWSETININGNDYNINHLNNYNLTFLGDSLHTKLINHPIYDNINTTANLKLFMERHVWAVWDFMVLLKSLQYKLTDTNKLEYNLIKHVWAPPKYSLAARMINEIVLGEETDDIDGNYLSHLDLYILAMDEVGANNKDMKEFIEWSHKRNDNVNKLETMLYKQPKYVQTFVKNNINVLRKNILEAMTFFLYGREDPIPEMFKRIVDNKIVSETGYFKKYLDRHIELDGDHHGPMGIKMINSIINNDDDRNIVALNRILAINERIKLWDGIMEEINKN